MSDGLEVVVSLRRMIPQVFGQWTACLVGSCHIWSWKHIGFWRLTLSYYAETLHACHDGDRKMGQDWSVKTGLRECVFCHVLRCRLQTVPSWISACVLNIIQECSINIIETSSLHSNDWPWLYYVCIHWQYLQSKFTRGSKNRGLTACRVSLALKWGIPGGPWRFRTGKRETFEMQDIILFVAIWAHNDTDAYRCWLW